ncbi:type 1 glutamine amidotransferase domain-containing protein [Flagellimonas meridianipacifica]|uniref:Putative intracellular protease/amidase n=1 Tax=Flagellimonas meridianipacifica TaxID=1080225 RepID=A0A2T0MBN9_9FLAO|nr:type 1 glutamine amidotransferase domain-containing protein [Allomuricauda pacifica]PRX54909.1 putative intracellular protease/amidase [Allomuricauda pacifica]
MLKKYPVLKWSLISLASLLVLLFGFGVWFMSLIPKKEEQIDHTKVEPSELPYLTQNVPNHRGRILAVVTSAKTMGTSGKITGYELTELSRAYYVFQANGFEVDIASPQGGEPKVIIDDEDMGEFDFAFLNDSVAQNKTKNTIPVEDIFPSDYQAVFFVGGKGAMFDFPENKAIQTIIRELYQSNKVVGAVCHGPAALVNVTLDNGQHLLENKTVSGFTNKEELLLIPEAKTIFPFLLQDKLEAQGAQFNEGAMYLEQISHEKNLVTGQNPWSTWKLAETMVQEMGYTPKYRALTPEENAVEVLVTYETSGSRKAKALIEQMYTEEKVEIERVLIAKHSLIAAMQGNIGRFFGLVGLTSYTKKIAQKG